MGSLDGFESPNTEFVVLKEQGRAKWNMIKWSIIVW
jgi:hypothetical protein